MSTEGFERMGSMEEDDGILVGPNECLGGS